MKYLLLASLTLSLALAQPTGFSVWTEPTPQVQGGQVCGTVKDASGNAMEYATVLLYEKGVIRTGALTDEDGYFTLYGSVESGVYALSIKHLSFHVTLDSLIVEKGMDVHMEFKKDSAHWEKNDPINPQPIMLEWGARAAVTCTDFSLKWYRGGGSVIGVNTIEPMTSGCQTSLLDARRYIAADKVSPITCLLTDGK